MDSTTSGRCKPMPIARMLAMSMLAATAALTCQKVDAQKRPPAPTPPTGQIVDAAGRVLGPVMWAPEKISIRALISTGGVVTSVVLGPQTVNLATGANNVTKLVPMFNGEAVYFSGPGCTGQAYVRMYSSVLGSAPSTTLADGLGAGVLYVASGFDQRNPAPTISSSSSRLNDCQPVNVSGDGLSPVVQIVDLSTIMTAPFTIK